MTAATVEAPAPYQFKPGPYSSHALLLAEFPRQGEGRRVLDIGCAVGYLSEILAQRGFSVTSIDLPDTPHPPGIEFAAADLDRGLPPWTAVRLHHLRRRAGASARTRAIVARVPGAAGARRRAHRLAAQQRPCLFSRGTC